jgi:rod shape-determining protein MreC
VKTAQSKVLIVIILITLAIFVAGLVGIGINPAVVSNYIFVRPAKAVILALKNIGRSVILFSESLATNEQLVKENNNLNEEIITLNEQLKLLQSYYYENSELKNALGIKNNSAFKIEEAQVLWYSFASNTIVIDKGTVNSIKKNMPVVVSSDGKIFNLVGIVSEASAYSASVLLSTNTYFNVTVKNLIRGGFEVAKGNGQSLTITSYQPLLEVYLQDLYVTSGYGDIFPEGIVVGKVASVSDKNSIKKTIILEPNVNFETLLRVTVITGNG